jgi:hypothetical protein
MGEASLAGKTLLECSFLIPTRRDKNLSDGRPHRPGAWDWLENELSSFGGATRDTALQFGWYEDPDTGERISDYSRKYTVALPASRLRELRRLLRAACGVFRQKCIYLSVAGHVEFVRGSKHAGE